MLNAPAFRGGFFVAIHHSPCERWRDWVDSEREHQAWPPLWIRRMRRHQTQRLSIEATPMQGHHR